MNEGPASYIINARVRRPEHVGRQGVAASSRSTCRDQRRWNRIARDARGNALGGVRTPAVDAPISTLDGTPQPTKTLPCSWAGTTTPFDPATLQALYPTHDAYVAKVKDAAAAAVTKGFLLAADEPTIIAQAKTALIRGLNRSASAPIARSRTWSHTRECLICG